METKNSGIGDAHADDVEGDMRVGRALGVLRKIERGHPGGDRGAEIGAEREGDGGRPVENAGGAKTHDDADRRRRRVDHRGHAGGDQHAFEKIDVGIGLEGLQQRHDFGHVAQRAQAAGHQVEAVEDQREAHAGERDVPDLLALGEAIDQREHAGQDQPERAERQGDQAVAERGADIGAHDHADRRPQGDDAGIDQADDHDGHRRRRLDDAGDQRSCQHALDRRSGCLGEKVAHPVDRKRLDAVRHELQAEHEDAQPADHRHEDVLEDIYVHFTLSPTSRRGDALRSSVAAPEPPGAERVSSFRRAPALPSTARSGRPGLCGSGT